VKLRKNIKYQRHLDSKTNGKEEAGGGRASVKVAPKRTRGPKSGIFQKMKSDIGSNIH